LPSTTSLLFCTRAIHNSFSFSRFRTLCPKHPGVGALFSDLQTFRRYDVQTLTLSSAEGPNRNDIHSLSVKRNPHPLHYFHVKSRYGRDSLPWGIHPDLPVPQRAHPGLP
jgi:hypothetical protein